MLSVHSCISEEIRQRQATAMEVSHKLQAAFAFRSRLIKFSLETTVIIQTTEALT